MVVSEEFRFFTVLKLILMVCTSVQTRQSGFASLSAARDKQGTLWYGAVEGVAISKEQKVQLVQNLITFLSTRVSTSRYHRLCRLPLTSF
jgi:hypothetical protein